MASDKSSFRNFDELDLIKPLYKALNDVGYETPTPIQSATIPPLLEGRDIIGQAQTGTGKTAAFALPLLSRIDIKKKAPQILVLTPTRELAIQVSEAFQQYASHIKGFQIVPIYGGQGYGGQLRQLGRGVHVVVGTPGRVTDHIKRKTLILDNISSLVLDEADEMLNMGFIEDIEWIIGKTPPERQTALFSATVPAVIRKIAKKYLKNPQEITIKSETKTADNINQRFWMVSGSHKLDSLTRILESEDIDGMLVFVRTKLSTAEVSNRLEARGYASAALNGDIPQHQREKTIDMLKSGKIDILVATDVAARGLDVDRISHVINYDIPYDTESYIHRVGRTGRMGKKGEAILFVAPRERRLLSSIEKATRKKIKMMNMPSTADINDRRIARFKQRITDTLAMENNKLFYEIVDQYRQEYNVPAIEIAAALAKMAQGDESLLLKDIPKPAKSVPVKRERRGKAPSGKKTPVKRAKPGMEQFRIEVGQKDNVKPGNIVGAIANEAQMDSEFIGRIEIRDDYSIVSLPEGMPDNLLKHLKRVWVAGKKMNISRISEEVRGKKKSRGLVSKKKDSRKKTRGKKESPTKRS